jgi:hypothetical protein
MGESISFNQYSYEILLGIGLYYNRVITAKNRGLYRQIKEQDSLNEEMEQMTKRYENLLTSVSPSVEAEAEKERPGDKLSFARKS